ncbi:MAG: hypothetical protein OHK005_03680 [Candidatus Methylacidiphilales bacterium]
MRYGDWFEAQSNEILDLDIIVGERPGGEFGAYLFWQQDGVVYEKHPSGHIIPAPFQLSEAPLPKVPHPKEYPLWKAVL